MKINEKQTVKYRPLTKLVLTCTLTLFSLNILAQNKYDNKKEIITPGKRQAVLILSDGSRVKLSANDSLNYSTLNEIQITDSLSSQPSKKRKVKLNDKNGLSSKRKVPTHTEATE